MLRDVSTPSVQHMLDQAILLWFLLFWKRWQQPLDLLKQQEIRLRIQGDSTVSIRYLCSLSSDRARLLIGESATMSGRDRQRHWWKIITR
ncbi:putative proline-rich receptor-like protein kinase PERK13 [Iris pallida]|uniref:Proline-rich receptor-like protein kinase PERK13 n=1 Tax=Iris pallida TaxID=29817 RepID=A0AAX6E376_IRIPA|nr:putative proline-rich receptor-like protein kinase PERK13 [Iris pallida]